MVTALAGALQSLGADTSQQLVSRIYGKVTVILGFLPVLESMFFFFKFLQVCTETIKDQQLCCRE